MNGSFSIRFFNYVSTNAKLSKYIRTQLTELSDVYGVDTIAD